MNARELYARLERDFITPALSDDWARYMRPLSSFLTDSFKARSMGLVCDHSSLVTRVYTAVFPSHRVMQTVLDRDDENILLFVHHPEVWDITQASPFTQMDTGQLWEFKARGISIYNLHVPLDAHSEYSTSVSLARVLGISIEKPFALYYGGLCGVLGKTLAPSIHALGKAFSRALGHRTSLYPYGQSEVSDGRVAVAAGGGNSVAVLTEAAEQGINVFVTGVTALNDHSREAHAFAQANGISLLGGTHYSTEKPACQAMCGYFERLGLPAEYIEDSPQFDDL